MSSDPRNTLLYRVAHGSALPSIVERGILCRRVVLAERIDFQTISNEEIEDRRSKTAVPCDPGGTLHDFVPFHFGWRSPMMYRISCRNLPEYIGGQRPLVYLVTTVGKIVDAGLRFVIADGHPIMALTDFFDELGRLDAVDLPLMRQGYWKDTAEDPDRERRRQAEFLVHERVPWDLITEIGVMDAAIKRRVEDLLVEAAHRPAVAIRRSWYYDEKS